MIKYDGKSINIAKIVSFNMFKRSLEDNDNDLEFLKQEADNMRANLKKEIAGLWNVPLKIRSSRSYSTKIKGDTSMLVNQGDFINPNSVENKIILYNKATVKLNSDKRFENYGLAHKMLFLNRVNFGENVDFLNKLTRKGYDFETLMSIVKLMNKEIIRYGTLSKLEVELSTPVLEVLDYLKLYYGAYPVELFINKINEMMTEMVLNDEYTCQAVVGKTK